MNEKPCWISAKDSRPGIQGVVINTGGCGVQLSGPESKYHCRAAEKRAFEKRVRWRIQGIWTSFLPDGKSSLKMQA